MKPDKDPENDAGKDQNITGDFSAQYKESIKNQTAAWTDIIRLTDQMVDLASSNNWQQIDALHQLRDEKLQQFFDQALAESLIETVQNGIAEIQAKDQTVIELIKQNRDELGQKA